MAGGRLASIQALRMIKALARLGWTVARVAGSHHILTRAGHPSVTIPVRKGATLKEGTARSILRQAGIGRGRVARGALTSEELTADMVGIGMLFGGVASTAPDREAS